MSDEPSPNDGADRSGRSRGSDFGAARRRRSGILVLAVVVSLLAIAWAGRAAEGRRALVESDAARARGDANEAILAARIAAEARCPGCSAPDEGFARLEQIAREAETRGDNQTAFTAWRAVRGATLATATLRTTSARRARAEAKLAELGRRIDASAVVEGATSNASVSASERRLREVLEERGVPSGIAFVLVAIGAAGFAVGVARYLTSGAGIRARDVGLAAGGVALGALGLMLF